MAGNKTRIMYIEQKSGSVQCGGLKIPSGFFGDSGPAVIGKVLFSKTGRTLYYKELTFQSLRGSGVSGNYFEVNTGAEFWISGPKKNGQDRHWAGGGDVYVDPEVAEEYWNNIRGTVRNRKA